MPECVRQLELFQVRRQEVLVDFKSEGIGLDAGLLPSRQLDQQLGILVEVARRMADTRDPDNITHSVVELLTQNVLSILGSYQDDDAKLLRNDPLMKTTVGSSSEGDALASTSTIKRYFHADTRRDAHLEELQRGM